MNEKEARQLLDETIAKFPQLKPQEAPAPSSPPDHRPRKSRYGRAAPVRIDRNTQARDRIRGQLILQGRLKYAG
jgi:hypothetical protein